MVIEQKIVKNKIIMIYVWTRTCVFTIRKLCKVEHNTIIHALLGMMDEWNDVI